MPAVGRHKSTMVCFSCGESGHGASQCPILDNLFPLLPPGWQADWTGDLLCNRPGGGLTVSRRETLSDPGRGVSHRISNKYEPHIPVVSDDMPCPTSRDAVVSRVGAVRNYYSTGWCCAY